MKSDSIYVNLEPIIIPIHNIIDPYYVLWPLGMAMGRVFSGIRPTSPQMGRGLILINGFGTGLGRVWEFFKKLGAGSGIAPTRPAPIIYKIKFKF